MKKIVKFAFAAGLATMAFFFTNTEEANSLTSHLGHWECVDAPMVKERTGRLQRVVEDGNYMHIWCSGSHLTWCWKITHFSLDLNDGWGDGSPGMMDLLEKVK